MSNTKIFLSAAAAFFYRPVWEEFSFLIPVKLSEDSLLLPYHSDPGAVHFYRLLYFLLIFFDLKVQRVYCTRIFLLSVCFQF